MELSESTGWWLVAGALVAVELATGTFYLLMLALGASAAALAAHLGMGMTPQLLAAASVGGGAVFVWYRHRRTHPRNPPAASNRDVILDVGGRVTVRRWNPDGTAQVNHRGANWQARWAGEGEPQPGEHVIAAIEGNQLMLAR